MKKMKKYMLLVMLAIFTMSMAIPVQAKTETKIFTLYPTKDAKVRSAGKNSVEINIQDGKVTDLQSSNKSVASVETGKSKYFPGQTFITAKLKKAGKTIISYKYKEKGKTKTYKAIVNVKKYVNPVASIKINNMKIKGTNFKNTSVYKVKYSKFANKNTKITITPAKGWRLSGNVKPYEKSMALYKKADAAYKREDYDALEKIEKKYLNYQKNREWKLLEKIGCDQITCKMEKLLK